jgi:hypothetical protein
MLVWQLIIDDSISSDSCGRLGLQIDRIGRVVNIDGPREHAAT